MDHQQRAGGHLAAIPAHGDGRGNRGSDALHAGGHLGLVAAQVIGNRDAIGHVTAWRVDMHGQRLDLAQLGDGVDKRTSRGAVTAPPIHANLISDPHVCMTAIRGRLYFKPFHDDSSLVGVGVRVWVIRLRGAVLGHAARVGIEHQPLVICAHVAARDLLIELIE